MANHKNRVSFTCPECGKCFEIIKARENKSKRHFCSAHCRNMACGREKRLYKYPKVIGSCKQCGKDIVAKYLQMDKPTRKFCSESCRTTYRNIVDNPILKISEETRKRIGKLTSLRMKGKKWPEERRIRASESTQGEKHWNWQGGLTPKAQKERSNLLLKEWRRQVFGKGDFTCKICGKKGGYLNAHHVLPWSKFPEFRYKVQNGVVLCKTCHFSIKGKEFLYAPRFLNI